MNNNQFQVVCAKFELIGDETKVVSLENLNSISRKGLNALPYSTLQLHIDEVNETVLEWEAIFKRLIESNLGGLCYERDEVLYQLLKFIGYEVYRIEASGIIGPDKTADRHDHMAVGVKLDEEWYLCDIGWGGYIIEASLIVNSQNGFITTPRYDHMAVAAKIMDEWYLCDIGWAGFMYEGAVKISSEPSENNRFVARCVQSTFHEPEDSELVPGATRWWDLEWKNPKWEYPDYDNLTVEEDGTWKKSFRFRLEAAELEDFKYECHMMNTCKSRTLYNTSILARCGEKEYRGKLCPYWHGFFGYQEMQIIFISNRHFVRITKLHDNLDEVNRIITDELNINIESKQWRCGSLINVIHDPTQKSTEDK